MAVLLWDGQVAAGGAGGKVSRVSPAPGATGAGSYRGGRKTIRWIEKCHALICF
jgi:hypothetical protein